MSSWVVPVKPAAQKVAGWTPSSDGENPILRTGLAFLRLARHTDIAAFSCFGKLKDPLVIRSPEKTAANALVVDILNRLHAKQDGLDIKRNKDAFGLRVVRLRAISIPEFNGMIIQIRQHYLLKPDEPMGFLSQIPSTNLKKRSVQAVQDEQASSPAHRRPRIMRGGGEPGVQNRIEAQQALEEALGSASLETLPVFVEAFANAESAGVDAKLLEKCEAVVSLLRAKQAEIQRVSLELQSAMQTNTIAALEVAITQAVSIRLSNEFSRSAHEQLATLRCARAITAVQNAMATATTDDHKLLEAALVEAQVAMIPFHLLLQAQMLLTTLIEEHEEQSRRDGLLLSELQIAIRTSSRDQLEQALGDLACEGYPADHSLVRQGNELMTILEKEEEERTAAKQREEEKAIVAKREAEAATAALLEAEVEMKRLRDDQIAREAEAAEAAAEE